jgi:hypothetical protein
MLRHLKFRPYIRRLHGTEEAHDLLTQVQLGFYIKLLREKEIKKAYVLTQRGFSNHVIAVASNKSDLMSKVESLEENNQTDLKRWSINTQKQLNASHTHGGNPVFINLSQS